MRECFNTDCDHKYIVSVYHIIINNYDVYSLTETKNNGKYSELLKTKWRII